MERKIGVAEQLQQQPGFYARLVSYIEQDMRSAAMYRAARNDFPDFEMPASLHVFNTILNARTTWVALISHVGYERAERLYTQHQQCIRPFGRHRFIDKTLDELLAEADTKKEEAA